MARNEFNCRRQHAGSFITSSTSGIYAFNNLVYLSNVHQPYGSQKARLIQVQAPNLDHWTFEPGWFTDPIYLAFNTIVSDRQGAYDNDVEVADVNQFWVGATPTVENNLIEAPTQETPVTTWAPIDRADLFKPVTGSAAIDAVSTGDIPVRDFAGNIRRATTNLGAHDVSNASAGTVPAPVNTSLPVVGELPAHPDNYHASSLGVWDNLTDMDEYLQETYWELDGLPMRYPDLQDPWVAAPTRWLADDDPGTPTALQVRQKRNASGVTADASGTEQNIFGFESKSGTIDPGLSGAFTAHFTFEPAGVGDPEGPVSLASTSTATVSLTGSTGTYEITGNGDGTFSWQHVPFTGDLTVRVTFTNRSGLRASASSAPLAIT